jgi:tellurite resistance protein TerB
MGFFKNLVSRGTNAVVDAKNAVSDEVSKLNRQDDVAATLAVVALVAGADGEVEPQERAMAVDFVRNGDVFKNFDRTTLADTLESYFKKSTNPIMRDDLFDVIKAVADEPDTIRKVIRAGIAIAGSDGEFEPQEKEVLLEVCELVKVPASEFRQLR